MTAKVYQISDHKRFKKKINLHYDFKTSFTLPPQLNDYPAYEKYKSHDDYCKKAISWADQQAERDILQQRFLGQANLDLPFL